MISLDQLNPNISFVSHLNIVEVAQVLRALVEFSMGLKQIWVHLSVLKNY